MPAEFPGTSLICMSNLPNKYSFFVTMPEPESLSNVRDTFLPPSDMLARLSPKRMLKSWLKLPPKAIMVKLKKTDSRRKTELQYEDAILVSGIK